MLREKYAAKEQIKQESLSRLLQDMHVNDSVQDDTEYDQEDYLDGEPLSDAQQDASFNRFLGK